MTELVATTPGLYPLPDWAKEELADLKGHQKGDLIGGDEGREIGAAYERARSEVVDRQTDAGLDRVVEGQLRWDDMLAHPLTVNETVETGGIVRYYDNNNFYRDPQVREEPTVSGDVAGELEQVADLLGSDADDELQAVLPGPYSLAKLATDEHYGGEAEFLAAVADYLAGEVETFPEHRTLFLLEPSLVTDPPGDELESRVSDAIDAVAAATPADVVVHTYWGSIDEDTYVHLMDADVEAFGFDLVGGDPDEALDNINEYRTKSEIALGVVDGQNTLVESADTIAERVEWVQEGVSSQDFERIYVTSNTELFYLPVNRFEEKLEALGRATSREVIA